MVDFFSLLLSIIAVVYSNTIIYIYIYTTKYNDLGMSNFPEADLYGPENLMGRFGKVCLLPQKILSDMFFFCFVALCFCAFYLRLT